METNGLSAAMSQFNVFGSQPISHTAQIGVSIEPETQVTQLVPATVSTLIQRMRFKCLTSVRKSQTEINHMRTHYVSPRMKSLLFTKN